ncbi:MAG: tRNA (adenosine(37)-N6)-threonylcarbamoyltransferase complex dimerization subunit type 1 TsaB [Candidatus Hydrothermia bacterium]|nr:tRNA (adenosine(37)-N6)-threonylcarbamoyltransferase complex dimerization subunit type 1 TsaB [Candidatus Hydrothermia bacterium]
MLTLCLGNLSAFPSMLLADGDKPIYFLKSYMKYSHQENLIKMLDLLLKMHNSSHSELKQIAIYEGPGLFTSLRIGYALAKAFYLKNPDYRLFTLNSLDVLASLKEEALYIPCLPAQKGEVFYATYKNGKRESNYSVAKIDELRELYPDYVLEVFSEFPDAETLFRAFSKMSEGLQPEDPRAAEPFYIKLPDAYMKKKENNL